MAGYDGRGARFNIVAVESNDLSFTVTAVDDSAAAVDLSSATITATIYNAAGTVVDTFTDAVSGAGSNIITLSLTDTEVDALTAPHSWALVVTRGGDARTWLAGSFTVADAARARNGTSGTALTATVDSDVNVTVSVYGDAAVAAHTSDTVDAHDASAVSLLDTAGNYTATTVEAALAELPSQYAPRLASKVRFARGMTGTPQVMGTPPTLSTEGPGGSVSGLTASVPYDTSLVTLRGCLPTLINQFSTDYYYNGVNGDWTPPPFWVEFDYYGDDFALVFRDRAGGGARFWVWVDGVPATTAAQASTANGAGSKFYYRVQFASTAQRRIRIFMRLADFGGLVFGPTDTVSPVSDDPLKIAFLGDSWVEGALSVVDDLLYPTLVGEALSAETFLCGQGSTSFIDNGGDANKDPYTASVRLDDIIAAAPDVVVVCGSTNDDGDAGIQAAAEAVIAALVAGLPSVKIILSGPPITSSTVTANRTANNTAVLAAASSSTNVIGTINSVGGGWITGTGYAGATTGTGNGDVFMGTDAAHLTTAGHLFWATRTFEEIYNLLMEV